MFIIVVYPKTIENASHCEQQNSAPLSLSLYYSADEFSQAIFMFLTFRRHNR